MLSLKSSIACDSWSVTYVPATTIFAFETESREGDQAAQARRHARGKEARNYSRRYWEVTNIIKSRTDAQGYTLKLEVREIGSSRQQIQRQTSCLGQRMYTAH